MYLGNGRDEQLESYQEDIANFERYLKTESINTILSLIVLAYKDKYAQQSYFYSELLVEDAYAIEAVSYTHLTLPTTPYV